MEEYVYMIKGIMSEASDEEKGTLPARLSSYERNP